jgi:chemotaxis protein histidine kinase CheA
VLDGHIDFASREGMGTTFTIRFPLTLAEQQ